MQTVGGNPYLPTLTNIFRRPPDSLESVDANGVGLSAENDSFDDDEDHARRGHKLASLLSGMILRGWKKEQTRYSVEKGAKPRAPTIQDFEILKPISRGAFG